MVVAHGFPTTRNLIELPNVKPAQSLALANDNSTRVSMRTTETHTMQTKYKDRDPSVEWTAIFAEAIVGELENEVAYGNVHCVDNSSTPSG